MVKLYTDGSCITTKRCGGWAATAIENDRKIVEICGGDSDTTNNIMELRSVIEGLKRMKSLGYHEVEVYTDSMYVKNGITIWINNWVKNNWKNSKGEPVKNKSLWVELLSVKWEGVTFNWVKAHNGDKWNEEVDTLAFSISKLLENRLVNL